VQRKVRVCTRCLRTGKVVKPKPLAKGAAKATKTAKTSTAA
jgi:hypothetical protein